MNSLFAFLKYLLITQYQFNMGGGSGASTPQAVQQDTQQVYTPWFTDLQRQLGGLIGQQADQTPALTNQIQGGGTPTQGAQNIWTPRQTPTVPLAPSGVTPQGYGALSSPQKAGE